MYELKYLYICIFHLSASIPHVKIIYFNMIFHADSERNNNDRRPN